MFVGTLWLHKGAMKGERFSLDVWSTSGCKRDEDRGCQGCEGV